MLTDCCRLNCPVRFIRLYDNTAKRSEEKKKKEEEKKEKKRRWREQREEEEVKDSREKEFIETYISSLKDRGETTEAQGDKKH